MITTNLARLLAAGVLAMLLTACAEQPAATATNPEQTAGNEPTAANPDVPAAVRAMMAQWDAPEQAVAPFWIFDNIGYIGIDWVAAYVIRTSDGLIVIDALYGKWIDRLLDNIRTLGLDPNDIRYVLVTHGHFDHAGGAARLQKEFGARIVMSEPDWELAEASASDAFFGFDVPPRDITGRDGDIITLGDTRITLLRTPGHTPGVLSMVYDVYDGPSKYTAITLGGVGLNFSGVAQTEAYIDSYERLLTMAADISVSLPNHAAMAGVFEKRDQLRTRAAGASHPFVDAGGYANALTQFLANANEKLVAEKAGTARDPMAELLKTLGK